MKRDPLAYGDLVPMPENVKVVVVPTYNERANIRELVASVMRLPGELHMLVVDDDSPDGTGDIAEGLTRTYPRLRVLHRTAKRGLGRAYVAGMKLALDAGADLVLQMDADFSHDPRFLPAFVAAARDNDLVLGSRYCRGGRIEGWAPHRRLLSRTANCYVRTVAGLRTTDNTGAFRCWRGQALARIDLDAIVSDGYSFMVEMVYLAYRAGLSIGEIPIIFVERREGQSKLSKRVILESMVMPWRLVLGRKGTAREGRAASRCSGMTP